jgi:hypothetical protein
MTRWVAAVAIVLCVSPARLHAQTPTFTVTVASAPVRQSPSAGSPVIGYKGKGEALEIRRNLGAWIEVAWPASPAGVAYLSASMGLVGASAPPERRPMTISEFVSLPSPTSAAVLSGAMPPPVPGTAVCACTAESMAGTQGGRVAVAPAPQLGTTYVAPTHFVGIGGRLGGATRRSIGPTGRFWSRKRIGVQVEMARETKTNTAAERFTSHQFAGNVLVAPRSHVGDYLWVRPYLGGGTTFYHSTLSGGAFSGGSFSDNALGFQAFGGAEFTFSAAPRFALSGDLGYHKWPETFASFGPRKLGIKVSGHWYVR